VNFRAELGETSHPRPPMRDVGVWRGRICAADPAARVSPMCFWDATHGEPAAAPAGICVAFIATPGGVAIERQSHYFHARLSDQFGVVLHFDHTRAVEPLERTAEWTADEVPETFPTGI
jgi:hypothetical protein